MNSLATTAASPGGTLRSVVQLLSLSLSVSACTVCLLCVLRLLQRRQKAAELRAQTADIALPSASPCCEQKQEQQQQLAAACRLPAGPGIASCSSSSSTSLN